MKIDIFTHVMLPRYKKALYRYADRFPTERAVQDRRPILTDSEARLEKLAPYPDLVQILTPTMPPVEEVAPPHETADLARLCNDEMAETVGPIKPPRLLTELIHAMPPAAAVPPRMEVLKAQKGPIKILSPENASTSALSANARLSVMALAENPMAASKAPPATYHWRSPV